MLLSVIVPVFNEKEVLEEFYKRTCETLDTIAFETEILFINDGSTDSSLELLTRLRNHDPRVAIIDLSRNFGKEVAMTAGLDHSSGDVVVIIDADLQDPPELIPELIKLSPQHTVHAKTIYSAVNVLKRVPPGPVFALLSTEPCFISMGDGYWTFDEALIRPGAK